MRASNRIKWLDIIERQEVSDLNIAQFCRQQQLSCKSFYRYKTLFNLEGAPSKPQDFVKVNPPELTEPGLKICTPAATMMLPASVCPVWLATLLKGLQP
jgi:hypothetical protein